MHLVLKRARRKFSLITHLFALWIQFLQVEVEPFDWNNWSCLQRNLLIESATLAVSGMEGLPRLLPVNMVRSIRTLKF